MNEFPHTQEYPKRRKRWPWVLGISLAVVVALCGFGFLALGGTAAVVDKAVTEVEASYTAEAENRKADVKLTGCKGSSYGTVEVKYTIVNKGSTERTYVLDIEMTTPDKTRVGTANGFAENVQPGKTVKGTAVGTLEGSPKKFTCALVGA